MNEEELDELHNLRIRVKELRKKSGRQSKRLGVLEASTRGRRGFIRRMQADIRGLVAEVERLRAELKESQFTIECLAGTPAHGGITELATLRAKAALADEIAVTARRAVENPENTWAENGGWKASDFLARYTALAERKETTDG